MAVERMPKLRLFYALWPDATTRAALVALQRGIEGRPVRPENLHLTLAFLGQQPATALPLLQTMLDSLPAAPLPLELEHGGYFARHRIAWIGPETVPAALLAVQQALVQALLQAAIRYDSSARFVPHVTLARDALGPPAPLAAPIRWRTSQIALLQSNSLAQGVQYQILAARTVDHLA